MQAQDEQSGEVTRSGGWSVSDAAQPDAEPATRTARKTGTGGRKTSSSRRTTKKDDDAPKTAAKRKTSKTAQDDDKPKTAAKRKTSKTAKDDDRPKTAAKRKTSKTAQDDDAPKTTAKRKTSKPKSEAKTSTSKRKTTKKETGKPTTKRRSRRKQDLGDLISELLERRASGDKGTGAIVEAILEHLTKNMGLSPDAAELVVGYILDKLVKSKQEKAAAASAGEEPTTGAGGFDLSSIFQQTRSGPIVDITPVASADELQELAQSAGLDPAVAEASLGQVLKMLGEAEA